MNFAPLGEFIDSLIDRGIPSADVTVLRDHETLYRHMAGWRDREAGVPLRGDELYFMYSCSKPVTVTAAMQLFERGLFLLNDPLYEYMPEFRDMTVRDGEGNLRPAKNPILIRHLFSMTAGLDYDLRAPAIQAMRQETGGRCPTRAAVRAIARGPLSFEPGEHWQYSLCHDVLAALVEVISGRRFADYVRENIFDPLGMTRSAYHKAGQEDAAFAAQYRYDDEKRRAERVPLAAEHVLGPDYDSGGAGVISCAADYAKFVDAMACGGVGATGERVLSRAAIDLMRENQLGPAQMKDFNWSQMAGYGYGLGVRTVVDRAAGGVMSPLGEFGWGGAAGAYVMIDPANRLSVFYAQHMLNNKEPYVHPRLRNITYACLAR